MRRAVLAVLLLLLVTACGGGNGGGGDTSTGAGTRPDGFVTRDGTHFEVDGEPFRFVGFNLYDAAASDIYSCSPSTRLDDEALADAMTFIRDEAGATVVRFWAYQTYTAGGTDFSGTDRVIDAARKAGLRVMPVLEDGPGNCSTGESRVWLQDSRPDGSWFTEGYKQPYGNATVSYRDYARIIAQHYRDDPTVLAWTLVNEAETPHRTDDVSDLVEFARDMAAVVHRADPRHLVTLGTQSNGALGASGADFRAVYELEGMDFTEVHDYAVHGSDTEAMPGGERSGLPAASSQECRRTDAPIACSFAIARRLDKPIVVGEAGIQVGEGATYARRAKLLDAKMRAAFHAGASGYVVWQLNTTNTDGYALEIGSTDPLLAKMRERSAETG